MKKSYEVVFKAYASVLVIDAENEDDALELAENELSTGDFEVDEFFVERVLKTPAEVAAARRRANAVSEPR